VQLNFAAREVAIKLVYYGPGLSGKTTNLKALHQLVTDDCKGRLMTLETKDDRTLFFAPGLSLRVKVFTVPGQVIHASTRKLVLQGADGVAFIADSRRSETASNAASFLDLKANLEELGRAIAEMPVVIQFNKRDLPDVRPDAEVLALAQRGKEPVYKAVATSGEGVAETFVGLLHLTYTRLDREHELSQKLGMTPPELLELVSRRLGGASGESLLAACLGGFRT
jgi:signal recognition particle receptor subunit beta